MQSLVDFLSRLVLEPGILGAVGFFLGAVLEELVAPLPSPLLLIGAAFFFGKPLSLYLLLKVMWYVILPITLGATVGSLIVYAIAYHGGKTAIIRMEKWLGLSWESIEKGRARLSKNKSDELILLLSRSLPFSPTTLVTIVAGVIRMNVWMYTIITFLGVFIRVTVLFVGALIFGHSLFG